MLSIVLLATLSAAPAGSSRPKLIVLELTAGGGVDQKVASAFSEAIADELSSQEVFSVISAREIQVLLGVERERQLTGCSADGGSCMAELAGALGGRFVMSGSLVRLGESYQLTLQTLDTERSQPVGRATRLAPSLEALHAQLPYVLSDAAGTPRPTPPSRVLPYSLMAGGGAVLIVSGLIALDSLARDAALQRDLDSGTAVAGQLRTADAYRAQAAFIGSEKTAALGVALVGAGALAAGFLLNPKDTDAPRSHLNVALLPGAISVAGVFQ